MKTYTLLTGASGGIGADFAKILAREGNNLILVARKFELLFQLQQELKAANPEIDIIIHACDLSSAEQTNALCERISNIGVIVSCLINNAGSGHFGQFSDYALEEDRRMAMLNMYSVVQLTKHFVKDMKQRGHGKIMNVASTAAFFPGPGMAVYYATKAFILSFSSALAEEVREYGITVTALCPGPTKTGFQSAAKLDGSRLFRLVPTASSVEVARFGIDAMNRGKTIAVQGILNKISVQVPRLLPKRMLAHIIAAVQAATKNAKS